MIIVPFLLLLTLCFRYYKNKDISESVNNNTIKNTFNTYEGHFTLDDDHIIFLFIANDKVEKKYWIEYDALC